MNATQALVKKAFELYITNCNSGDLDTIVRKVLSIGPLLNRLNTLYNSGQFSQFAHMINYFSYNLARGCDVEALVQYTLQSSGDQIPNRIGSAGPSAPPE